MASFDPHITDSIEKEFNQLISNCGERLSKISHDSEIFPQACHDILAETTFSPKLEDLDRPFLWQSSYQHYKSNEFSHFPLTLHSWGNYFLELYVWTEQLTGIHDHHFSGAFKVLCGDYQQTLFSFTEETEISSSIYQGKLNRISYKEIPIGVTTLIPMGEKFIHCVNHSQKFNMTLCLRSVDLRTTINDYFLPGFKISMLFLNHKTKKELDLCWLLLINHDRPTHLPCHISDLEILRYTLKKVASQEESKKWRDFILSERKFPQLDQIQGAINKTSQLWAQ